MTLLFAIINKAIHFIFSYIYSLDILSIFSYFFILQNIKLTSWREVNYRNLEGHSDHAWWKGKNELLPRFWA